MKEGFVLITIINEKLQQAKRFADALGGMSGTLPGNYTVSGPYVIDEAAGEFMKSVKSEIFSDVPIPLEQTTKTPVAKAS